MPSPDPAPVVAEALPHLDRLAEVAAAHAGDSVALLSLLRQLEKLHRTIQDGAFRASLPSDRGSLFRLLQDMEQSGGWPYIPRLQLRTFLDLLQTGAPAESQKPLPPVADDQPPEACGPEALGPDARGPEAACPEAA
jgi:hypothetical protein